MVWNHSYLGPNYNKLYYWVCTYRIVGLPRLSKLALCFLVSWMLQVIGCRQQWFKRRWQMQTMTQEYLCTFFQQKIMLKMAATWSSEVHKTVILMCSLVEKSSLLLSKNEIPILQGLLFSGGKKGSFLSKIHPKYLLSVICFVHLTCPYWKIK